MGRRATVAVSETDPRTEIREGKEAKRVARGVQSRKGSNRKKLVGGNAIRCIFDGGDS